MASEQGTSYVLFSAKAGYRIARGPVGYIRSAEVICPTGGAGKHLSSPICKNIFLLASPKSIS